MGFSTADAFAAMLRETPGWLDHLDEEQIQEIAEEATIDERRPGPTVNLDGPAIPEGTRNTTLASIGGKLRACGAGRAEIETKLLEVNDARCTPPLDACEVRKIAQSMMRYEPGDMSTAPDPETLRLLDGFEAAVMAEAWPGTAGATDRSVLLVLIDAGRRYGRSIPAGVRVSLSFRDLRFQAVVSSRTAQKSVRRLKQAGWLTQDQSRRRAATDAGAFVLRRERAEVTHSPLVLGEVVSVLPTRVPPLRWSGILKKSAEAIIHVLGASGGEMAVPELAAALGKKRVRDLFRASGDYRSPLLRLTDAGVVVWCGDVARECEVVRLASDWETGLELARIFGGEKEAKVRDKKRIARERETFRLHLEEQERERVRRSAKRYPARAVEQAIAELFRQKPEHRASDARGVASALYADGYLDFTPEIGAVSAILDGTEVMS